MFDYMLELITQAASNSLFIFYFCNLIIVVIILGSKTSSINESGQESEIPLSVVSNTLTTTHKQQGTRNVNEMAYAPEAPFAVKDQENGCSDNNKDDDHDHDHHDDELRRRVEEFIEKVNKEWKAEFLRSSRLDV